ncbi:DedA family protein [Cohnella ginsengisoli]|uniref:DedA family protein n=1 Tax=Cohnella ginsengisoli TaxID=425004 RepID=A0A9X4QLA1_9BACL|nr:DedA family protein [Cohnella ginsengisoli]MDG0790519.1 DedA family protein [Cohnella ginsengisoli]
MLTNLLAHYGYGLIFLFLCLEMLALPLPGEMMMSYIGLFVYEQKLGWLFSIVSAGSGVLTGVTLSYWIGYRLGRPFIVRHGHRFHLTESRIDKLTLWFEKYGAKLLFIAYFIPGVRHVTGYFCGVTRMPFRRYALFAYTGAIFWVGLFISLGKVLGPKWELYHSTVNRYMIIFGIASAIVTGLIYVYRKYKQQVVDALMQLLTQGVRRFHSFGKVRLLLLASFALFVLFFSLMLGVIQDFFGSGIRTVRRDRLVSGHGFLRSRLERMDARLREARHALFVWPRACALRALDHAAQQGAKAGPDFPGMGRRRGGAP